VAGSSAAAAGCLPSSGGRRNSTGGGASETTKRKSSGSGSGALHTPCAREESKRRPNRRRSDCRAAPHAQHSERAATSPAWGHTTGASTSETELSPGRKQHGSRQRFMCHTSASAGCRHWRARHNGLGTAWDTQALAARPASARALDSSLAVLHCTQCNPPRLHVGRTARHPLRTAASRGRG
jgi:hypothetical protein